MSYEVYIDVRHHPRHNDEDERVESTAFKLVDPAEPLTAVADCLRVFADEIDQRVATAAADRLRDQRRAEAFGVWEQRNKTR